MGRSPSFDKGLKKGPWTSEEDQKLVAYIEEHGHGSWRSLPVKAGLERCGKSCRLRWMNYLRPDIKRGNFTLQEQQTIIQLHALLGNRWSSIASHLPKRTDNEIKNYWNTHLKKRLTKMGIDPITHKSRTMVNTTLSHMTQWENARLEAEARLVRGSKGISSIYKRNHCDSTAIIKKPSVSSLPVQQPQYLEMAKAWQGITLSKLYNLSGLETLNEKTIPNVNLVENIGLPSLDDITMEDQINKWKISKSSFNALGAPKDEGTERTLQASDMIYHDHLLTDDLTNHLINNDGRCNDDFEDDNSYWSSTLNKLGNNSSFSYTF